MVFTGSSGKVWNVSISSAKERHLSTIGLMIAIYSSESLLRRALFEDTGGMYPELITRPDIKIFLPPIGNLTVYVCTCLCFYAVFIV